MKTAIRVTVFVFIIFYLGGVFCYAEFDITKWDLNGRLVLGSCLLIVLVFSLPIAVLEDRKN